jgi:hypothetical protein
MRAMASLRYRDESGQVAGLEALAFGVLVFVLGILMVANAWGVIQAKAAVTAAAHEAARAFVQAPAGSDPFIAARDAALGSIEASGRDPSRTKVLTAGSLARCTRIVAQVSYRVPLLPIPLIGGYGNGITATARQSELVDPYRNGIGGEASCAQP